MKASATWALTMAEIGRQTMCGPRSDSLPDAFVTRFSNLTPTLYKSGGHSDVNSLYPSVM